MSKQEFLSELKAALGSRVNARVVSDNMRYYEDYINAEIRKGRSEDEVLRSLGDPRLIARSIADAEKRAGTSSSSYEDSVDDDENDYREKKDGPKIRIHHIPVWLIACVVILIVFIIISAAFSLLSYFMPILIPIMLVVFICRLLRNQ